MRPLVYALAGAGVVVALAAGPVTGQSRPGGAPGGGGSGGGAAVRAGGGGSFGGGSGSSGGSRGVYSPGPSGGHVATTRSTAGSSGSSGPSGASGYRVSSGGSRPISSSAWASDPVNGSSPIVRQMYGSPGDQAVPRGSRPYGSTPYVGVTGTTGPVIGHAVPRQLVTPQRSGYRPPTGGGGDINWGYNPWIFAGLGFYNVLYADPYWLTGYWFPYDYGYTYDPNWDPAAAAGGYDEYEQQEAGQGALRLKIEPASAAVYVDGAYMGTVNDFNGIFKKMQLPAGPHHVEVQATGYRSIAFDVRIEPDDTVTYRGELQPLSQR